jgi:hypothetical protein
MPADDYVIYNMPAMLGRSVTCPDPNDPNKWIRDEGWYDSVRMTFFALFRFFQDQKLLRSAVVEELSDTDAVVLRLSDLTPEGRTFVQSGADDRWLASFDRPGSKKQRDDVSYLEKQLQKMRAR